MVPDANDRSFNLLMQEWPSRAITHLYHHYYHALVRIAEHRTHDRKASEDIVQEVFIELWRKSRSIARRQGFLVIPYIVSIVKKRSITVYRNKLRQSDDAATIFERLTGFGISKECELIQSDNSWMLQLVVTALPARQKQCIEMRFLKEMSIESIAIRLSITTKAVEKNITKGLKRLRTYRSAML